jgi:hypothetical protein
MAFRLPAPAKPVDPDVPAVRAIWRDRDLARPRAGPASHGRFRGPLMDALRAVSRSTADGLGFLFSQYTPWNYVVAALAVVLLSYAL